MSVSTKPRLRRILQPLIAPEKFDFWAGCFNRLWTWERPLVRIVARRRIGPDAVELQLRGNRHLPVLRAGQHINISAEIDGRQVTRSYSPWRGDDGRLCIGVKAVPGGRLSRYLCEEAKIGQVLEVAAGFGEMTWPATPPANVLMLAAGSGITPLFALLREAADRAMDVRIDVVHWAATAQDHWFADEIDGLSAHLPGLRVHRIATREPARDGGLSGRISAAQLAALMPDGPAGHQVFACGPEGFVARARALLVGHCMDFHAEAFTPPVVPTADDDGQVRVHLARRGLSLDLPRASTLLAALEAAGLNPSAGCRMGICHTCACGKRSGTSLDVQTGQVLTEPDASLRLCVSRPLSDLVLDL